MDISAAGLCEEKSNFTFVGLSIDLGSIELELDRERARVSADEFGALLPRNVPCIYPTQRSFRLVPLGARTLPNQSDLFLYMTHHSI